MLRPESDLELKWCREGAKALEAAHEFKPQVILQDLVMPDADGLDIVTAMRADPELKDIPLVVLSANDDAAVKAEAFGRGANDYLVKLPAAVELVARLRYHARGYKALLERNTAYSLLHGELQEAAAYVRSILPPPITTPMLSAWTFIPSSSLGGDSFSYHWLDDDHFALYVLDVCGHGVGAALLSVSVLNALSARALPGIDFLAPDRVLAALNNAFPMERQNNLYFTIWYGVYEVSTRTLNYAGAGHPPPILLAPGEAPGQLQGTGLPIGTFDGLDYDNFSTTVPPGSKLYMYSDGVHEVEKKDSGGMLPFEEFIAILTGLTHDSCQERVDCIIETVQDIQGKVAFDDDCSLVEFVFGD
jgi:sigma-B regulation protein RsbU (phosphoserine phosphatase)